MGAKKIVVFFLIILLLSIFSILYPQLTGHSTTTQDYPKEEAVLNRVLDGDTIEVTGPVIGEKTHIRLLGINAPEKKMPFSNESANFLRQFIGKNITLERDKTDTDMYRRKLRYIYYDNRMLNLQSLELGLSSSYYTAGLKYEKQILDAEEQARNLEVGIWTKSQETCSDCIKLKELNSTLEYFTITNECSYDCALKGWFVKDAGRNTFYLSSLTAGNEETYPSKNNASIWNDAGDKFFMFDNRGLLVIYYSYP